MSNLTCEGDEVPDLLYNKQHGTPFFMESSLSIAGEVPGENEKMWSGVRSELLSLRKERRSK